jgi:hypothetical protein
MLEGLISFLIEASKGIDRLNEGLGKITNKLILISERGGAEDDEFKKETL